MSSDAETYIPHACDAIVAYFGWRASGGWRTYCVTCHEAQPLTDPRPVYGHDHRAPYAHVGPWIFDQLVAVAHDYKARRALIATVDLTVIGRTDSGDTHCDMCSVALLDLSVRCEREHRDQQERWARRAGAVGLVEYGIRSDPRCRIY